MDPKSSLEGCWFPPAFTGVFLTFFKKITKIFYPDSVTDDFDSHVTNIEKIFETICSVYDLIKLFLINKSDNDIEHNHSLIREEINLDERI